MCNSLRNNILLQIFRSLATLWLQGQNSEQKLFSLSKIRKCDTIAPHSLKNLLQDFIFGNKRMVIYFLQVKTFKK